MNQERLALLAMHCIPGIGGVFIKKLLNRYDSASSLFKIPQGKLTKVPGIGDKLAKSIATANPFEKAEMELKRAQKENVEIIFFHEEKFPKRLTQIDDGPTMLYVQGNLNLNAEKMVGIIGTRQATPYGKKMVEKLLEELIPHKPIIISGLAYGIDIHAHKKALSIGMPTLGILGSGINIIYPDEHRKTAEKMVENGGLISENPFDTTPEAYRFPIRNRIIAGLADALLVIETANRGGSLITAEIANSYNKDVFAVPGNIGHPYSAGCNQLIKTHKANLITSIKDLEYIMGWSHKGESDAPKKLLDITLFEPDEQKIIIALQTKKDPMMIDELSQEVALPPSHLASTLLMLELKKIIQALPGKRYAIKT